MPATPARTTRSVVPPAAVASKSTIPNATSDPMNAPPANPNVPAPIPRITTTTAPVDAPDEIPRMNGSASGFLSNDCRMTPHTAKPAPQAAASSVLGKRRFQTMASLIGVSPELPPKRCDRTTSTAWDGLISEGPMVTATATDPLRITKPSRLRNHVRRTKITVLGPASAAWPRSALYRRPYESTDSSRRPRAR